MQRLSCIRRARAHTTSISLSATQSTVLGGGSVACIAPPSVAAAATAAASTAAAAHSHARAYSSRRPMQIGRRGDDPCISPVTATFAYPLRYARCTVARRCFASGALAPSVLAFVLTARCTVPRRSFSSGASSPTTGGASSEVWGYPSLLSRLAWASARKKAARHAEIGEKLNTDSATLPHQEIAALSKEHHALTAVAELVAEIESLRSELSDLKLLASCPNGRAPAELEMASLAAEEIQSVTARVMEREERIIAYLLPGAEDDRRDAILEVRAGTGGDEAALFAREVFHMYESYAALRGWRFEVLEVSDNAVGGYKECSASISGDNVFGVLKHESGVHRVQRVPATETKGRVHTSAATVAIMPEAEEVDITLDPKDLRIDVYRAGGAGGQHVNKTESAVRITHIPTGVQVAMQDERSQIATVRGCLSPMRREIHSFMVEFAILIRNRIKALKILRSRLYEASRQAESDRRNKLRSDQLGSGDRSEKIRTYNYPQSRITDHRLNLTVFGIEKMMRGELLTELSDQLMKNDVRMQLHNM